jgi:hypothetical protein
MRGPEVEILPPKVGCQDELDLDALVSGTRTASTIFLLQPCGWVLVAFLRASISFGLWLDDVCFWHRRSR